jgi:hypothetical protein
MRLPLNILTTFLRSFGGRRLQYSSRKAHLPNIFERRDSHLAARTARLRAARSAGRIRNQPASTTPPSTTSTGDIDSSGQRANNHKACNEGRATRRQRQRARALRRYSTIIASALPTPPSRAMPGAYMAESSSSSPVSKSSCPAPDLNEDAYPSTLAQQKIFYDALFQSRQVLLRAAESPHVRKLRAERARHARERKEAQARQDAEFARLLEEDFKKAQAAHLRAQEEEFVRLLAEDMQRAEEAHRRALVEEAARRKEEERRAEELRRQAEAEEAARREEEELRRRAEEEMRSQLERQAQDEFVRLQAIAEAARAQQEASALRDYETKWTMLRVEGVVPVEALRFCDIPWPMFGTVWSVDDITLQSVGEFLFHAQRECGQGASQQRKSIRLELLRWHPDKFHWQVLDKVIEGHREAVKEAAGHVARILTQLSLILHDR